MCQFITVKELPTVGYLYYNACNDVTCAWMPVQAHSKSDRLDIAAPTELLFISATMFSVLILTNIPGNILIILALL